MVVVVVMMILYINSGILSLIILFRRFELEALSVIFRYSSRLPFAICHSPFVPFVDVYCYCYCAIGLRVLFSLRCFFYVFVQRKFRQICSYLRFWQNVFFVWFLCFSFGSWPFYTIQKICSVQFKIECCVIFFSLFLLPLSLCNSQSNFNTTPILLVVYKCCMFSEMWPFCNRWPPYRTFCVGSVEIPSLVFFLDSKYFFYKTKIVVLISNWSISHSCIGFFARSMIGNSEKIEKRKKESWIRMKW